MAPKKRTAGRRATRGLKSKHPVSVKSAKRTVGPAGGKLGVMLVGLGAVATTFIAGVENVRRGNGRPIGSVCELGTIRLGRRTEGRAPRLRKFVPLARLEDLVFAAWDPIPDDAYQSAKVAGVLEPTHIEPIAEFLKSIVPMPAVFDQQYVKRLQTRLAVIR